jgi:hypothetical protein
VSSSSNPDSNPGDPRTGAPIAWTAVGSYPTRAVAQFASSILEGNGYEVRIVGDDAGGVLPHLDAHRGGIQVEVPAEDAEDAVELLADLARPSPSGSAFGRSRWRTIVMVLLAVTVLATVAAAFLTGPSLLDL